MIPKEFEARMREYMGNEAELLFAALGEEPVRSFRVNLKYCSPEDFAKSGRMNCEKMPFAEDGFYTDAEKPGHMPEHHAGMIYMQDPSAMATVHALDFKEGWRVLDCCAAPGGKSTQISAYIGSDGILVCNEYVSKRCRTLRGNVERMGCDNAVVLNLDTKELAQTYPYTFDVVLADVPCSGEGMFRKNDVAQSEWSLDAVEMCAVRQREILENVYNCVRPGGYLLYSTCTFSLEENEMNIDGFLDRHLDFELCPINPDVRKYTSPGINFEGCRHDMSLSARFYPHVSRGEGQFIALMHRKDDCIDGCNTSLRSLNEYNRGKGQLSHDGCKELATAEKFLLENLVTVPHDLKLVKYNNDIYLKPDIDLPQSGVFCCGVCVGEVQKGRLLPHHHLFSALGQLFKNQLHLSPNDKRLKDYIHGDSINVSEGEIGDGWGVVCVNSAPLGGIKTSFGVCKNHYPKGLRE